MIYYIRLLFLTYTTVHTIARKPFLTNTMSSLTFCITMTNRRTTFWLVT